MRETKQNHAGNTPLDAVLAHLERTLPIGCIRYGQYLLGVEPGSARQEITKLALGESARGKITAGLIDDEVKFLISLVWITNVAVMEGSFWRFRCYWLIARCLQGNEKKDELAEILGELLSETISLAEAVRGIQDEFFAGRNILFSDAYASLELELAEAYRFTNRETSAQDFENHISSAKKSMVNLARAVSKSATSSAVVN